MPRRRGRKTKLHVAIADASRRCSSVAADGIAALAGGLDGLGESGGVSGAPGVSGESSVTMKPQERMNHAAETESDPIRKIEPIVVLEESENSFRYPNKKKTPRKTGSDARFPPELDSASATSPIIAADIATHGAKVPVVSRMKHPPN